MPGEPALPGVAVIGAGIVGASIALELTRQGHAVILIEPDEPGGPQAASHGNGAWISPASVVPMSLPGLWRKVPGFLMDPLGPLTIRWTSLPGLLPWLVRFVRAGSSIARVEATARALAALLHDAPKRHLALAEDAGVPELIRQTGLIYAYPDRAAFEAEALSWRLRRDNGLIWQELEGAELHQHEPAMAARYGFGVRVMAGAHCADPGVYVRAIVRQAQAMGARLVAARATGFALSNRRVVAVHTDRGDVACARAVIAAGIHSAALALTAGDPVPLASERGYHVEIAAPPFTLSAPVMPSDGKMANTSLNGRLRASGQVELAAVTAAPDWRRAFVLLKHLESTYPALQGAMPREHMSTWMGHRPSTPDGLPVIGPARESADIFHAFGHGHVGLATAPATAEMIRDLVANRNPAIDIRPFAASRFR